MKYIILSVVTLLTSFRIYSQDFDSLLFRAGMSFKEIHNLTNVKPIENRQMNWEKAFKSTTDKFEVRYAIRPIDVYLKEYDDNIKNKQEGDVFIHPNKWFKASFETSLLNISGGEMPNYDAFDFQSVKQEFNADWGATAMVKPIDEFGQGYKFCLVVFLHKDNLGDCFIFYLADDVTVISYHMESLFHNLRFKL